MGPRLIVEHMDVLHHGEGVFGGGGCRGFSGVPLFLPLFLFALVFGGLGGGGDIWGGAGMEGEGLRPKESCHCVTQGWLHEDMIQPTAMQLK